MKSVIKKKNNVREKPYRVLARETKYFYVELTALNKAEAIEKGWKVDRSEFTPDLDDSLVPEFRIIGASQLSYNEREEQTKLKNK